MAERRNYSDDDRANALAALAANEGNIKKTAKELGLPERTLAYWQKNGVRPKAEVEAAKPQHVPASVFCAPRKGDLADALEQVAWKIVELLPDAAEVAAAKGQVMPLAIAMGTAIDKARLLRGESTEIKESRQIDVTKLGTDELRTFVELLGKLYAGGARPGVPGEGPGAGAPAGPGGTVPPGPVLLPA